MPSPEGANFSVYSKYASGVELLFFDRADDARPCRVIRIDPAANRTYHYWHVYVPGVKAGQIYGYRVSGAFDPSSGMRFDDSKLLLDPYGLAGCRSLGSCSTRFFIGHTGGTAVGDRFVRRALRKPWRRAGEQ
jgi:pullulanase/glycogen debranching enzyme